MEIDQLGFQFAHSTPRTLTRIVERGALGHPVSHQPPQAASCGIVPLGAKSMIYKYFTAKSLLFKDLARILRLSL